RQPFAERLRRLVCYCVVRCWSLIYSRQQGQVGEYTDATALPRLNSYNFFNTKHTKHTKFHEKDFYVIFSVFRV
ncbi:MAG: hypothetical protein LBG58_11160, partial [Planctomycetaceae bacterium]|nr:hypothetical protein [Planctomycetaceae bacterium]